MFCYFQPCLQRLNYSRNLDPFLGNCLVTQHNHLGRLPLPQEPQLEITDHTKINPITACLFVLLKWSWLPGITPLDSENISNNSSPGTHADLSVFARDHPSQGFRDGQVQGMDAYDQLLPGTEDRGNPAYGMEPNHGPECLLSPSVVPQAT